MPPKPAKINITYLITHKLSQLILENSFLNKQVMKNFGERIIKNKSS